MKVYREDELPAEQQPAMAYVSETLPGVARGPHEHVDQTDSFAFSGRASFCSIFGAPGQVRQRADIG